jgi:hypothetical protein
LFSSASYIASGSFISWMIGKDVGSLCTNVAVMLIAADRGFQLVLLTVNATILLHTNGEDRGSELIGVLQSPKKRLWQFGVDEIPKTFSCTSRLHQPMDRAEHQLQRNGSPEQFGFYSKHERVRFPLAYRCKQTHTRNGLVHD